MRSQWIPVRRKVQKWKGMIGFKTGLAVVAVCNLIAPELVYAGGADKVTKAIDNIKTLLTTVVSGIGAIIAIKSIMDFSTAYQSQDNTGMNTALRGIVGGAIMTLGGGLLTWLGLS